MLAGAALLHVEAEASRERSNASHDRHHHAEPGRDHAPADGRQAQQRHHDPAHPVDPAQDGDDALLAGDRGPQEDGVDDGVRVGAVAQDRAAEDRAHASNAAIRRSAGSASSSGQSAGSGGHQAWASCSGSGVTSTPSGSHACPMSIARRFGRETSASTVSRSGVTDHSSSSSRPSVSTGSSPTSTAPPAPSAQRPAHEATQPARRPASQRPSAERVTHSAASEGAAPPARGGGGGGAPAARPAAPGEGGGAGAGAPRRRSGSPRAEPRARHGR